jgi:hypothetical protein
MAEVDGILVLWRLESLVELLVGLHCHFSTQLVNRIKKKDSQNPETIERKRTYS